MSDHLPVVIGASLGLLVGSAVFLAVQHADPGSWRFVLVAMLAAMLFVSWRWYKADRC